MSLEEKFMPAKELSTWERGGETALLDARGRFWEVNPAMRSLVGQCDGLRELVHSEDWQELEPGRRRVRLADGQIRDLTLIALDEGWLVQLHPVDGPGTSRELFHQIKNHLTVVSSLLQMQASLFEASEVKQAFADCQTRVHCLALLYGQVDPLRGDLDFAVHLRQLLDMLRDGRSLSGVELQLRPVTLKLEQAVPLSLIAHELIANSLRHAPAAPLEIQLEAGLRFSVADTGPGLPAGIDAARSPSLGLRLIRTLARQLRAQLTWETDGGTRCSLTFTPTGDR